MRKYKNYSFTLENVDFLSNYAQKLNSKSIQNKKREKQIRIFYTIGNRKLKRRRKLKKRLTMDSNILYCIFQWIHRER